MTSTTVTFVIFFVGIAAFVEQPGGKLAVFPAARNGAFGGVLLEPHTALLHLRGKDLVGVDPADFCNRHRGRWEYGVCSIELRGAKVSVNTTQPFDDQTSGMPRLGQFCPGIWKPKRVYTEGSDPDFVAARFELTGGTAVGCRRVRGAYVTRLTVATADGQLAIERGGETLRIPLGDQARIAIENRPDSDERHRERMSHPEHYGWYYFIASGILPCSIGSPPEAKAEQCQDVPGVKDPPIHPPSATGPDCGNTGYP